MIVLARGLRRVKQRLENGRGGRRAGIHRASRDAEPLFKLYRTHSV